ncbi:pullulanase-type alpha-1,6-glucosidase [Ferrimonas senticii]|uniref:pullulanase-type alpha-1,6-glucosidase n=1 Tax=Ferrimonas senticii TaxID=394566 RepID=UPI000401454C|nr:pullulanase-type alpha-1,6-glucosidase [Ferrimonas senticii]
MNVIHFTPTATTAEGYRKWSSALLAGCALLLAGCDSDNDTPTNQAPEPVTEIVLPVSPNERQAVIYYNRADQDYSDWGLHLWGAQGANFVSNEYISDSGETDWAKPQLAEGIDPTFGAYYVVELDSADWQSFNFIVHKGDEKDVGGGDHRFSKADLGQQIFTFSGNGQLFVEPLTEPPLTIEGASSHWLIDANGDSVLLTNDNNLGSATLYASATAELAIDGASNRLVNGNAYPLTTTDLSAELQRQYPHLADFSAWRFATEVDANTLLKQQLVLHHSRADGSQMATQVQLAGALDGLYGDAASQLDYFPQLSGNLAGFTLWAPTAQQVSLVPAYFSNGSIVEAAPIAMSFDDDSGAWTLSTDQLVSGDYYRYELTLYHPLTMQLETYRVADPYSLSVSTNSTYSQLLDLDDSALQPSGWLDDADHQVDSAEQIIIYEAHIRDFSNSDQLGSAAYNGKYLAFTETERESVSHLQSLADAGLTHFHLLPSFDIASVNENPAQRIDLTSSKAALCALNPSAALCSNTDVAASDTIAEALARCDVSSGCGQQLLADVRGLDSFNWGYDPLQYSTPEGSYASDANGSSRVLEFRQMVHSLHQMGLSVVMDVVYNHTASSGLYDNSVLDRIVPGYYHRLNPYNGSIENSTCCENTASEHRMMEKLMVDSLVHWAKHYQIDGFRFDLMGHHSKANIETAYQAVTTAVNHFIYFYGEGWNFGEVANDARFVQATQANMAGTGVGSFSDRIRDSLRGGGPFDSGTGLRQSQGFTTGLFTDPNELNQGSAAEQTKLLHETDIIRVNLAGGLKDFLLQVSDDRIMAGVDVDYQGQSAGYTDDPQELVNYVSKHDNQTLWDNNQYKLPTELSAAERVRVQNLALNTILVGQGVPFLHMGAELLRSKSMERDSYDSGDWFNSVWFDGSSNGWNRGLPRADKDGDNWPLIQTIIGNSNIAVTSSDIAAASANLKEFLGIRASSALFALADKTTVMSRVDFHNTGADQLAGVIAMSIDDGLGVSDLDPLVDALMVIINARPQAVTLLADKASGFSLHPSLSDGINDDPLQASAYVDDHGFNVPARTVSVFVKAQGASQGAGLAVTPKTATPTTLQAPVHVRGSLYGDGWPADDGNLLQDLGGNLHAVTLPLTAGNYQFKLASSDWSTHNWGSDTALVLAEATPLYQNGGNINLAVDRDGDYQFLLNISNLAQPTVTVSYQQPSVESCSALDDVAELGPLGDSRLFVRGDLSGWNAEDQFELSYKGNNIYQALFSYSGTVQFKLADASPNWDLQYFVSDNGSVGLLQTETDYRIQRGNAGTDNNSVNLDGGNWRVTLTLDEPLVLDGDAGNLLIEACNPS